MFNTNTKNNVKKIDGSKATAQKGGEGDPQNLQAGHSPKLPSREELRGWLDRDIKSAIAVLSWVDLLPGLKDMLADAIYDDATKGPKIPN